MALPETYIVQKGDTLSEIAEKYYKEAGYSDLWKYTDYLADLNNLKNKDFIVVGQKLKLSGSKDEVKANNTYTCKIGVMGLVSDDNGATRQVYVDWSFDQKNTDHYTVDWDYLVPVLKSNGIGSLLDGVTTHKWLAGSDEDVTTKYSVYTVPAGAKKVRFKVVPVAKTYKQGNKNVPYWKGTKTTWQEFNFDNYPPATPTKPSVSISGFNLTVTATGLSELTVSKVEFRVYSTDSTTKKYSNEVKQTAGQASASFTVAAGHEYYVKCRAQSTEGVWGNWSDSSDIIGTPPAVPTISKCVADTETSIQLEWDKIANAKSYKLQYTTNETYFEGSDQVQSVEGLEGTTYLKTGLEIGQTYFFRIKAINDDGESGWSEVKSTILGSGPAAPSTWSSTTTVMVGEKLTLYWVHNTEDGSEQTGAKVELEVDGETSAPIVIEDDTNFYELDTSGYTEGTIIRWRVCTSALTGDFGDWSVQRRIDVYKPPSVTLTLTDASESTFETLVSFPFKVSATVDAGTQKAIGYHITIEAGPNGETFETTNNMGETVIVKDGDVVYSEYFDKESLSEIISANNVSLENGYTYTVKCLVTMDSGLTAEASESFMVGWSDDYLEYEPNASISIDEETLIASIQPFVKDLDGNLIENIELSVYRRNYDGTFTKIFTGIDNANITWVIDPHPALDYARYRIIAKDTTTGGIRYTDITDLPIGGKEIIIQWDEDVTAYDGNNEDELASNPWGGSMLKLPYNVDVSDTFKPDVERVSYIGREHPVVYYGTHLGESSKWNAVIDKKDTDTLYKLRRLAKWMGDVYVREPSGSGYWANVTVSWNQKHDSLTIPISIDVVRVEGGK